MKTQKNTVYLPTIRQLTCNGFCNGVPFLEFPERQREWISRAFLPLLVTRLPPCSPFTRRDLEATTANLGDHPPCCSRIAITVLRLTWRARAIALTECPQTRSFIIRCRTRNRQRFALCRFGLRGAGAAIVAFSAVKEYWLLFASLMIK